jgi:hypothetical protein
MWNLRFWKLWLSRVASPSGFLSSGFPMSARLHGCTGPPTARDFSLSANGTNWEVSHLCNFHHPNIISPFSCTNILFSIFAYRPSTYLPFGWDPQVLQSQKSTTWIESRCGARYSAPVQTGLGAHPASYTMGTGCFPRVKRPGRDVDHPPHLRRLKKE